MLRMDIKGGSWVDDMYQRLEAMCVEVEEAICEDTLKYVENHVRTVGDTVKKFCSDVIQDLHSPSSLDSIYSEDLCSNVDGHDSVQISKKSEVDDEVEPVDAPSEQLVKDFSGAAASACDVGINRRSGIYSVIKPCEPNIHNSGGKKYAKEKLKSHGIGLVLSNRVSSVAKDKDCRNDCQNNCVSNLPSINVVAVDKSGEVTSVQDNEIDEPSSVCMDPISKPAFDISCNEFGRGVPQDMIECCGACDGDIDNKTTILFSGNLSTDLDMSLKKADVSTTITSSGKNLKEVDEKLSMDDIETASSSLSWEIGSCDTNKLGGIPVGEQFNKFKLEEPCVLVERNENYFTSGCEHARKSCKKRIQDVFSRGRWSKIKRDKEQFAVWYEDQICRDLECTCGLQPQFPQTQLSESFESDWELV